MRFFSLFRKKRKENTKRSERTTQSPPIPKQAFEKIESDVETCRAQLNTVNIVLNKHDDQLVEHQRWMDQYSEHFEKLEEKVSAVQIPTPAKETPPTFQPIEIPHLSTAPAPPTPEVTRKFDINRFSEQQKRVLAAFFQNPGMALAYVDIARMLNKSPHTVKNQMREIRMKADLFETSLGEQNRHRFKLKNDLRIEKYLNVG